MQTKFGNIAYQAVPGMLIAMPGSRHLYLEMNWPGTDCV